MSQAFSDEALMAFADGQADAATAQRIEASVHEDSKLAARVDMFRRTSLLAKQAFEHDLQLAVPDQLRRSVQAAIDHAQAHGAAATSVRSPAGAGATPIGRRERSKLLPWAANQPTFAFAASLAGLAFALIGYLAGSMFGVGRGPELSAGLAVTRSAAEQSALINALDTAPSGQRRNLGGDRAVHAELIASVRDGSGALCREFKIDRDTTSTLGVACRSESQWNVTFATATARTEGAFAPASAVPALDAYLSSIEASPPLSVTEEVAALGARQK